VAEKSWKVVRYELQQKILRIPQISIGAKLLWSELALNWCWNSPECCPRQQAMAVAFMVHPNSITKWINELIELGLISREKMVRSYRFVLATEIPAKLLDEEWRFSNVELTRRVKKGMTHRVDTPQKEECESEPVSSHSSKRGLPTPVKEDWEPDSLLKKRSGHSSKRGLYIKPSKGKPSEEEKPDTREERESRNSTHALKDDGDSMEVVGARCARACEGSDSVEDPVDPSDEKQRTYVPDDTQPADPSDLMEDPPQKQPRKNPRQKRGVSDDILGRPPGRGLRNAGKPPHGTKVIQAGDPPTWKPKDVLSLLRGEIEAKYGADAVKVMPMSLTGADSGKVKNALLNKYAPDVVMAMIRVLVWDWEVARTACFPFRPQVKYPTVEALVQYQETLAAATQTGLNYDGAVRGNRKTFASRYLANAKPSAAANDPF